MKRVRQPTADSLKRAAIAYVERYAASQAMLRAVLRRRVMRWSRMAEPPPDSDAVAAAMAAVEEAVAAAARSGLVDDARFAAGRTQTLIRKGWPQRRIRASLSQKGVGAEIAAAAMAAAEADDEIAARRFAQRRRLGPWRMSAETRAAKREKDIAAMMRAGFSLTHARMAIEDTVTGNASDKLAD